MCNVGGNLLWKCNVNPNDNCVKGLKNVFISEVINAWCFIIYDDNPTTPGDHIIWNNSLIRIEHKSIYQQSWHEMGIQPISDLLDDTFNYLSFETFQTKYSLRCHFLDYYSLIHAIPLTVKRSVQKGESIASTQADMLNQLISCNKVCKMVHGLCVDKLFTTPKAEVRWATLFSDMNLNWNEIYRIPMLSSHLTKLRYFQFRILHRIIGTNDYLFKIGYIDSNMCCFCNKECEDIPHLFWSCKITTQFWMDVQRILFKKHFTLTLKDVILGILDFENQMFNFAILHGKQYIFNAKTNNQHLDVNVFKRILKDIYKLERYIAYQKQSRCM